MLGKGSQGIVPTMGCDEMIKVSKAAQSHKVWRCWFVGGFDCAVVFVVLGDAGSSLLSPCNTAISTSL